MPTGWREIAASSEEEVEREMPGRKKTSKQTAANRKISQESDMSEASQIKRLWHHQTKMSGIQKCQKQRLLRDHAEAAPTPIGSPLSLQVLFRHPTSPGSICTLKFETFTGSTRSPLTPKHLRNCWASK